MSSLQKITLPGVKSIIAVTSGKGGVGKSFVTASLALVLAKNGHRVGILDADLSYSNMYTILGIHQTITPTADRKIVPAERFGLKVVSMRGLCGSEDEPIAWRGPISSKIIQQLLKETLWGSLDILFIDMPTGISDGTLTILQQCELSGLLLVSTSQELALIDTRRTFNLGVLLQIPMLGIIENMRGDVFGEGGVSRLAEKLHIPFLGSIPLRKNIVTLCDTGTPAAFQSDELGMIFAKIARSVRERILV